MKLVKSTLLLLAVLCTLLSTQSCKDECDNIVCQNGGTCSDGVCDYPEGFLGDNCEIVDLCFGVICENDGMCIGGICNCPEGFYGISCENEILQHQLDSGETPLDLVNNGVPVDSLYGKIYEGGLIFYLNTNNGTGMVAATEDQGEEEGWGCLDEEINGARWKCFRNGGSKYDCNCKRL